MFRVSTGWPKRHLYTVQECLAINAYCYLTGGFEDVLPDYVEMVERPAGACRRRFYLLSAPAAKPSASTVYLPPSFNPGCAVSEVRRTDLSVPAVWAETSPEADSTATLLREIHLWASAAAWYDVTPMLKAQARKRRDGLPDMSALDVLFQEFERNVYGIPVKRVA